MAVRRRADSGEADPERRRLLRRRRKADEEFAVTPVIGAPASTGPRVTTWAEDLAASRDDVPAPAPPGSWLDEERAEEQRIRAEQAVAQGAEATRLMRADQPAAPPAETDEVRRDETDLRLAQEHETGLAEASRLAEVTRLVEVARLAAEAAEADRITTERQAAQAAEQDRLAALTAAPARAVPDSAWLVAEADEAANIERERSRAQAAEQARLAALTPAPAPAVPDSAWLAAEADEAANIERERSRAQAAEQARLAALTPAPAPAVPDSAWLAAEADEAANIERERSAAQAAEQARLRSAETAGAAGAEATRLAAEMPGATAKFVQFQPGTTLRYLLGTVFVAASACAVLATFWGIAEASVRAFALAAVAAALAAINWWGLVRSTPHLVSIRDGMLDISRGADLESFDLREPSTPLVMSGDTRSRSWKATLRTPSGPVITLTARDVDPAQFAELVGNYRALGPRAQG